MLFKRRNPPSWKERLRVALWPRRNWARSSRYIIGRVGRLRGSPHAIALGFAFGVLVSFTPFIGTHFIQAAILAFVFRVSVIASAFGTFVGNPLTFPFIWLGSYKLGSWLLGSSGQFSDHELRDGFAQLWDGIWSGSANTLAAAFEVLWPLIKPMTVGGLPLGLVFALIFYYIVRRATEAYQARRSRFAKRASSQSATRPHSNVPVHEPAPHTPLSSSRR